MSGRAEPGKTLLQRHVSAPGVALALSFTLNG